MVFLPEGHVCYVHVRALPHFLGPKRERERTNDLAREKYKRNVGDRQIVRDMQTGTVL